MKHSLILASAITLSAACSTLEMDIQPPIQDDVVFFASFEQPSDNGTRVYANEDLLLRWTADDRVSIFNKNTYNQQYAFTGETGDNAGGFRKVESDEFMTGNAISNVVSVYPYQTSTKITESGVVTATLPSVQAYAENSFGLGANTMVSVTSDNFLQYKNVGGYLVLNLYGEGVSVSSITLKGNKGEKLAGKATVTMPLNGVPTVAVADDATPEITLTCESPVLLGTTPEESTLFWFVVPPVSFNEGFTITVSTPSGESFEKSTAKSVVIERNNLSKMSPIEVVPSINPHRYLTFSSEGETSISLANYEGNAPVLYVSYDKNNWTLWDYSELKYSSSQPLYICGYNPDGLSSSEYISTDYRWITHYSAFTASGSNFSVTGDVLSLIDCVHDSTDIPLSSNSFYGLFQNCISLTKAPDLPATVLADGCYSSMFSGCTGLTMAPDLPATTLAGGCYSDMFSGCTSLTTPPDLPATILASSCYSGMFSGCTSLTMAPDLPATVLANTCYLNMFSGCTSLTMAPDLPATTLEASCYYTMFNGCTSLTTPPDLPATTLAAFCYTGMFYGCTGLRTAPELPATTLAQWCYELMFYGCTSLTKAPDLPATTLAQWCYDLMFFGCSSLTKAPDLPATTLAKYCYSNMFSGCSSLTKAPDLPATTLVDGCYSNMFSGCTSLNYVKCLATNVLETSSHAGWLSGVASEGKFVKPRDIWWVSGDSGIPEGWTVLDAE